MIARVAGETVVCRKSEAESALAIDPIVCKFWLEGRPTGYLPHPVILGEKMTRSHTNQFDRFGQLGRLGRTLAAVGTLAVSSLAASSELGAQTAPPAQITVSARGEVQVTPDRARVQLGVETRGKTAAAAAAENNKKQSAILAAIKALGVPATQIATLNYNVSAVQRYDDKEKRVVIDGYQVSNIVQVYTDKLEQAGPIIDAALASGANTVAGLDFTVRDASKARDEALAEAIESARRQADVAAKAAGGRISELLEINISDLERPMPRPMMAMAKMDGASSPAPISEGTTTVSVSVSTRWRFERIR